MWFFLLFEVVTDLFRDHSPNGWAKDSEAAFRTYVREAAASQGGSGGSGHVNDLAKLAELMDKGTLNPEEYERAKAKLLACQARRAQPARLIRLPRSAARPPRRTRPWINSRRLTQSHGTGMVGMKFRIAGDGDEEALVDLQTWLATDPGTARLDVSAVGGRGPTMNTLEALDVLLGNAVEIANFALAYVTWRSVRRDGRQGTGADVEGGGSRLVHGDSTVDIGHLSPEELAELLRHLGDGPPPAADA